MGAWPQSAPLSEISTLQQSQNWQGWGRAAAAGEYQQPTPPSCLFPQVGEGGAGLVQPVMTPRGCHAC